VSLIGVASRSLLGCFRVERRIKLIETIIGFAQLRVFFFGGRPD